MSLPARERGSKPFGTCLSAGTLRRSPRGSADRNDLLTPGRLIVRRRSPRGSADRNRQLGSRCARRAVSLPARERGSKPSITTCRPLRRGSLPARERGSKPQPASGRRQRNDVAPRAGARIETEVGNHYRRERWSLPARERGSKPWMDVSSAGRTPASLPARERGSKRHSQARKEHSNGVAPRAGARIETRR